MKKKNRDYDSVFKTMKLRHKRLFISVINETFGEDYPMDAEIDALPAEGYLTEEETADGSKKIARQFASWDIGHATVPMPNFSVIYVKRTASTPRKTTITFTFLDSQSVVYESDNVILDELTKEYIVEKRLFPYIPFYIARYENALTGGEDIEEAVHDLEYFRDEMVRLHREKELSDEELIDLMGFVNTIITHITNQNENEERLVSVMGGAVFETESERLVREGISKGISQGISQANADTITRMLKKGKTPQEIHNLLDYPMEEIERITRNLQMV
jgi:hypothetical protein